MTDSLDSINAAIRDASPALWKALSPLGRRCHYPPDIPFQAAQARGKTYNGTIGQITDGKGNAYPLPSVARGISTLSLKDLNRALLYSPVEGIADLRHAWRAWHRPSDIPAFADVPSTLPLVASGITHGLSMLADLFAEEGRAVVVPDPYWDNYSKTFELRRAARLLEAPAYAGDGYDLDSVPQALAGLPEGEPAVVILNFPSNPGGYALTEDERAGLKQRLIREAERRPLVVINDDAYAGLTYEPDVPRFSFFWELVGAHPNLVPIKLDGITKELSFFGGRVGYVTFGFPADSAIAEALANKLKCLCRATAGSPVAVSQVLALNALESETFPAEVAEMRDMLEARYRVLKQSLSEADPELVAPKPFNAGCFAVVRLPDGVNAEAVRQHLLENYDTGLVSVGENHMRVAHCSVAKEAIPELVRRLEQGVADLARRGVARV